MREHVGLIHVHMLVWLVWQGLHTTSQCMRFVSVLELRHLYWTVCWWLHVRTQQLSIWYVLGPLIARLHIFSCQCLPSFTGPLCTQTIDFCSSTPCQNGGVCVSQVGSFVCTCAPGWTGTFCQTCKPIKNCLNCPKAGWLFNQFFCLLIWIFEVVNVCASNPCFNGGTCSQTGVLAFSCLCNSNYTGLQCTNQKDPCASAPCLNGGVCVALSPS